MGWMYSVCLVGCIAMVLGQEKLQLTYSTGDGQNISIYTNGQLNSRFNDEVFNQTLCCTTGDLYVLELGASNRTKKAYLTSNLPMYPERLIVNATPNSQPFPKITAESEYLLAVDLGCPQEPSDSDYYNKVYISINDSYPLSFMLDCDVGVRHKKFQIGYIVIAAINAAIILAVALHSRIWSYTYKNRELGIIASWKWLLPASLVLTGLGVLVQQLGVFLQAANICGAIVAAVCLTICLNEILYLIKALKKRVFKFVRICDIMSVSASIAIVTIIQLATQDFITNDFLAVCIIVALIKLFKFTSLKEAIFCCGIVLIIETVAAVVYHFAYPEQSYNDVFGKSVMSPLILQFPALRTTLYKKCSWVPITEVIFPGVALSYLRRFQYAREGKRVFMHVGNAAFCVSTVIWIFAEAVYAHTLPFAVIAYPGMFLAIILLCRYMNELTIVWSGKFQDPEFLHNQQYRKLLVKNNKSQILDDGDLAGIKFSSNISDGKKQGSVTPSVLRDPIITTTQNK